VIDPGYRHRRVVDNGAERYRASPRVLPEDWIPMMRTTYEELRDLAGGLGLEIVLAGAGAYSVHVLADPTKDIDYVLSKPIDVRAMIDLYEGFVDRLDRKGVNVVGKRIQQGRSSEDWVIQVFIAISPGKIVGIEVFNLLAVRPLSLYETEIVEIEGLPVKTLTLESWVASKLADPNGVDEQNILRLEKAVEKGFNEAKLFEILMRLGMRETIRINSLDVLRRTRSEKLKKLLSLLI